MNLENRFRMLAKSKPEEARKYFEQAQLDADQRWKFYQYMASRPFASKVSPPAASPTTPLAPSPTPEKS
jgi:hypothetical protein